MDFPDYFLVRCFDRMRIGIRTSEVCYEVMYNDEYGDSARYAAGMRYGFEV